MLKNVKLIPNQINENYAKVFDKFQNYHVTCQKISKYFAIGGKSLFEDYCSEELTVYHADTCFVEKTEALDFKQPHSEHRNNQQKHHH